MEYARKRRVIFSITTLGCKLNQYESELMREKLEKLGFTFLSLSPQTDLLIVNTCAVTNESERKSRQYIRKGRKLREDMKIIAVGCSPEISPSSYIDIADSVLGNIEKKSIDKYVWDIIDGKKIFKVGGKEKYLTDELTKFKNRTRAFLKIQDGCDERCTYCVIRKARGEYIRSKKIEMVEREFKNFLELGTKEIVLSGLNLGKYGKDIGTRLVELLKVLEKIPGEFRIRLSSINPQDITDEMMDLLQSEKFCRHLHIPIQSGSNRILKMMGRNYRVRDFVEKVEKLRSIDPLFSITTDVIVGFPGETDADFIETLKIVRDMQFLKVHIFRFSQRPQTPAFELSKMYKMIPAKIKERFDILNELSSKVRYEFMKKHIEKIRKVLLEKTNYGKMNGFDEYYIPHRINSNGLELKSNEFFDAMIESIDPNGKVVNSEIVGISKR